jgi:hypothetical protein
VTLRRLLSSVFQGLQLERQLVICRSNFGLPQWISRFLPLLWGTSNDV